MCGSHMAQRMLIDHVRLVPGREDLPHRIARMEVQPEPLTIKDR